jgi:hypothetical protein
MSAKHAQTHKLKNKLRKASSTVSYQFGTTQVDLSSTYTVDTQLQAASAHIAKRKQRSPFRRREPSQCGILTRHAHNGLAMGWQQCNARAESQAQLPLASQQRAAQLSMLANACKPNQTQAAITGMH